MRRAETCFNSLAKLELTPEELRQIDRFVLNTRGELLFADIAILAEGETEEQALQIFFKDYFGCEPFEMGVSFIGVGGKNYLPFLRVLECIGTDWLIFSDGEPAAINDLQATIKKLKNLPNKPSLDSFNNIIVYNIRVSANQGLFSESGFFKLFDLGLRIIMNKCDILHLSEMINLMGAPSNTIKTYDELRESPLLINLFGKDGAATINLASISFSLLHRFSPMCSDCFATLDALYCPQKSREEKSYEDHGGLSGIRKSWGCAKE